MKAAIAQAAHDTLVVLSPRRSRASTLCLRKTSQSFRTTGKTKGIALGRPAAKTILARRICDGSQLAEQLVT